MTPARLVCRKSLADLFRDRSVLLLAAFFAAMVCVTAWLGWSATATVDAVYRDAASYLASQGQPVPANPVSTSAPLAVLRNLGVYISLIGTFGAIVIGQLLIEAERTAGTLPLIGVRPVPRTAFVWGKMQALLTATGAMIGLAGVISVLALFTIPALSFGPADVMRLALFLLAGWAYLSLFGFVAMGAAARLSSTAGGLIAASIVWLVVTFILPELTANIHPTAAINPVTTLAATPDTPVFHLLSGLLGPLSLAEGFAWLSGDLLGFLPDGLTPRGPVSPWLSLLVAFLAAAAFAAQSANSLDLTIGGADA